VNLKAAILSLAIEQLMLEVCSLALTGGWYPNQVSHHRSEIQRLLIENNLDDLLKILPAEESEEFLHNLRILKLI